ncbi:hypothetical protein [Xanthomonas sacchari]|uniref:Glycosaminoglycan attachment site n=3 Tax=Xanthomonas sacchari TaxID=56458 RepID=A0A2P5Z1K0_9XANT|nr:hypothetical protein [Xanthomonas sacchari]MDV0439813.1 hypothetical protein [Xanthomonas sacchari]PPU81319.1 hypothetical protein XsacCFBP4641_15115 [Xanthomonas sacchari]
MEPLPLPLFDVFALALPRGLGFGENPPKGAWRSADWITICALTTNRTSGRFGVLVMRRREDDVWAILRREDDSFSEMEAMAIISQACEEPATRLPVSPGTKRRPPLVDQNSRELSGIFKLLAHPCRERGAWILNQLYLAMPNPDDNWASDCRTGNFHTRLWEALLFASLREQGLLVTQDHPSPDFHVSNRNGGEVWVEAVTANPSVPYDHAHAQEAEPPIDSKERMLGSAAARYAKTLKSKMDRGYARMPHVIGRPFAIAIADFHAPGSMVWSRVALAGYLYGFYAREMEVQGKRVAVAEEVYTLPGEPKIPAGLFFTPEGEELSAVIFSQGATLAKLSRVPLSFGAPSSGYRYVRFGELSDFTPGALRGIPFSMDVNTDEYRALWTPYGYEPWTAEMEVFHNPNAKNPLNPALLPEAAHWLPVDGVMDCKMFFKNTVLRSRTLIQGTEQPVPTVDDLMFQETSDSED